MRDWTNKHQITKQIATAAILIAAGLWAWRHDHYATQFALRGTALCIAVGFFAYLYVLSLGNVVRGNRPRFRITGLFAAAVAVAVFAATGYGWESVTFAALLAYTILCGPLWKQLVSRWSSTDYANTIWTSAAIVSSFTVLLTGVSLFVVILAPRTFSGIATVGWAMASTSYVSMEYIWHDEADTAAQYFLYGLPFGLVVNVIVGMLVGAMLGLVAVWFNDGRA